MQLEVLKSRNIKSGNPHLTYKLSAMTQAALASDPPSGEGGKGMSNKDRKVVINLDNHVNNLEDMDDGV